ncbi:winged helix DNA-binding domain-containing protein [Nocardioides sp. Soil805]|uniref:winged helix DNA-binding domain-containing protein n=1 Tax=Nocardioides sp. Soil805 TaxID=1736416 RepID=UPI000A672E85|nr:winged helix DNA-binding domain-containing protein [Nocardioides sp. Soil805]
MSEPVRLVPDAERRARMARRHGIAPRHRLADPVAATRAMTVLHSTEPPTPYLSVHARVDGMTRADLDRALYDDRSLVKQLAMRRTLFVFPRDLLPAAWGSASARVALIERRRIAKDVEKAGIAADGDAWLDAARARVLAHLDEHPEGLPAREVGRLFPELATPVDVSAGSLWNHTRLLTHLGLTAHLVRGRNGGHWRISRPVWVPMAGWLGEEPVPLAPEEGYAALVARWLRTFGPGTETDVVWWLGATKGAVRRALADLGALPVALESGDTGWLLPDDLEPEPPVEPWAALLPVLDATLMGWKQRDWYLDPAHVPYLFDTNGNGGTTAWWDGRVVGCYVQDGAGTVHVVLREDPGADARAALDVEAERLTAWLAGESVNSVYASRQMREARLP